MGIINIQTLTPSSTGNKILYNTTYQNELSSIFLDKLEYEIYKESIKNLLNKSHEVKFGEKIYLGKLSNLPRHKIKEYFQTNKINKTSKLNQSDTIILNKQYLQELGHIFGINTDYTYKILHLKELYFFELEDNDFIINNTQYYNNITKELPFCLLINHNDKHKITPKLKDFLQNKTPKELYHKSFYRERNLIEIFSYIEYIFKNPHVNIIFDEDLIVLLNKEGFELDNDYLSTLDDMFNSRSQDNINLALEMLSNVNIEKYSLTIALFLNKHKNIFAWGSGLNITQNNSFKSIIKHFKSKNINFESDWRDFSLNLYKLHQNNPENIKIIENFIHQNLNLYLKKYNEKNYLKLTNINLELS
jgi:hypothetical protein